MSAAEHHTAASHGNDQQVADPTVDAAAGMHQQNGGRDVGKQLE